MTYDRQQYQDTLANLQQERRAQVLPMARILAGAAPVMDRMTNSEDWNRYLTLLQGLVNRLTEQRAIASAKFTDPAIWNTESVFKLKSDILQAQAGIDWLNLAISLPQAIMEGAEKANSLIADFEAKNEAAGKAKS